MIIAQETSIIFFPEKNLIGKEEKKLSLFQD